MKKKLIGIGVATFGVLLSVGGAIALYTQAANDAGFSITASGHAESTGVVSYRINNMGSAEVEPEYCDADGNPGGDGINETYFQAKYTFRLGATFEQGAIAQSCVMGQITAELVDLNPALYGKVTVYAAVEGYLGGENSVGKTDFGAPLINNVVIEDGDTVCRGAKDISAGTDGSNQLIVWVKFANFDNYELDELNNLYELTVTWGDVSEDYNKAYIVGNKTQWDKDEKYAMYIQPEATTYSWIYDELPGSFGDFKIKCGNEWCHNGGENHALDAEKTYTVLWTAGNDCQIFEE